MDNRGWYVTIDLVKTIFHAMFNQPSQWQDKTMAIFFSNDTKLKYPFRRWIPENYLRLDQCLSETEHRRQNDRPEMGDTHVVNP